MQETYDVVIAGGGAAGLAAATTLARSRRSVLVVDAGEPRNAPADGVHNYLGREGMPPAELLKAGRAEVAGYGGEFVNGTVASTEQAGTGFAVTLADGRRVHARRLVIATGAVDVLPDVPGLAERWGRDVLHCPYCHGWEVRDQRIGVLASGPMALHHVLLFRQLSDDVTLFAHTGPAIDADEREQLAALDVPVVEGRVTGIDVVDDRLAGVRLESGRSVPVQALVVASRPGVDAEAFAPLGLHPEEVRLGEHVLGLQFPADRSGATPVPGVWVAGNAADVMATVIASAAAGVMAAARVNADLATEDARLAVEERRRLSA